MQQILLFDKNVIVVVIPLFYYIKTSLSHLFSFAQLPSFVGACLDQTSHFRLRRSSRRSPPGRVNPRWSPAERQTVTSTVSPSPVSQYSVHSNLVPLQYSPSVLVSHLFRCFCSFLSNSVLGHSNFITAGVGLYNIYV